MSRIEVLGGEPLASPVFRDVLAGPLLEAWPHVGVALTTNGSYLTECELARYAHVRFEHLMISLNAATPATYAIVNRGLAWSRIRANLDAVLAARQRARPAFAVTYSMVILRANVHEIEAFAALAEADGVDVRFMLPVRDRNGQSIMLDAGCLAATERALTAVVDRLRARGSHRSAARAEGELAVVRSRRARGVLQVLPDRDG
jgi:molybdenum cofactor biosynthesis enzyme MoaA